ncbi:MAG: head GIN domain-containing protein [Saprospiraceae bacterium]
MLINFLTAKNWHTPTLALAFLSLCLLPSCDDTVRGRGDLVTETRDAKDFHALEIGCNGDVRVRVDSVFKVEVTCEENIIAYLETVEENGVLKIYFDRNVWDVDDLKITVSAPSWDAFEIRGSADVDVLDLIAGDALALDVSGSGDLSLNDLSFNKINALISGSGDVEFFGDADALDASISGSGDLDALGCPVKTAKVSVSGSGDARLHVLDSLTVSISGSGIVEYKGSPQVSSSISGSGRVRKI